MRKRGDFMKILTVIGARPQFVKASVVSAEFQKCDFVDEVLLHTGQHYDPEMADIFFKELSIPAPKYKLNINGLPHGAMTGRMLEGIEAICIAEQPDAVLVYGDTNSTLAGALAGRKLNLRVIHVEAGLRSFNMSMPEEVNRIITDRISDVLFCPTQNAAENLKREGYDLYDTQIVVSGDVMEDATLFFLDYAKINSGILEHLDLEGSAYLVCTIHRAENVENVERLTEIVYGLNRLADYIPVVIPLHPRTRKNLLKFGLELRGRVIPPVGYFDMLKLVANCKFFITDSGGLQKEAFFLNKFCVTVRDETEWIELVQHGYNFLVGANSSQIVEVSHDLFNRVFRKTHSFYGGGSACKNIVSILTGL